MNKLFRKQMRITAGIIIAASIVTIMNSAAVQNSYPLDEILNSFVPPPPPSKDKTLNNKSDEINISFE